MQISGGGAGNVASSNITDGTIIDADINAAAAIALSKLNNLIGNPGSFISIETGTGTSMSLTTLANQRVVVWAMGSGPFGVTGNTTVDLAYNGVTKSSMHWQSGSSNFGLGFALQYTEIPGAGTHNITIAGSAGNEVIIVMKIMVG